MLVRSAKPYRGDERSFWDNAPTETNHKGFVPVPGFGEYYAPPAPPPEPEADEDDEDESEDANTRDDRWRESAIRAQPPEQGRWGNEAPVTGAYVPVPGFGEYYAPPTPTKQPGVGSKATGAEEDEYDDQWSASKVRSQPAEAGRWQPGDPAPYVPTPEPQTQSRGWFGFGAGARSSKQAPEPNHHGEDAPEYNAAEYNRRQEPTPSSFEQSAFNPDYADYDDDELRRLRVIYGMFRKTVAALRYIVPFTGGLACWIAAAQSLTAWWTMASMIPFLTGLLTFSMFGFLVTLGAAFFSGMYMAITVFTRTLRYMLNGRMPTWEYGQSGDTYQMQIAARSTQQARPGQQQQQQQQQQQRAPLVVEYVPVEDEPPDVPVSAILPELYGSPRPSGRKAAYGSSKTPEPEPEPESEPELEPDFMAAKPPPPRKRVDLPLDVLLGIGGGAVDKTTRSVSGGEKDGEERFKELPPRRADEEDVEPRNPSWDSAVREGVATKAGELAPDPAAAARREAVVPPSERNTVASQEQQQLWLSKELEREWEEAGDEAVAQKSSQAQAQAQQREQPAAAKKEGKKNGGWNPLKAIFGGGDDESLAEDEPAPVPTPTQAPAAQPTPAPPPQRPVQEASRNRRVARPATDAGFDPVMGALGWDTRAGEAANANASRAAEVAARLAAKAAAQPDPDPTPTPTPEPEPEMAPAAAVDGAKIAEEAAAAAVSEVRSQRKHSNDADRKKAEQDEWQKRVNGALRRDRDDER